MSDRCGLYSKNTPTVRRRRNQLVELLQSSGLIIPSSIEHPSQNTMRMSDVTQILSQVEPGDPSAAEKLLPLVYEELRRLAAVRMARELPEHAWRKPPRGVAPGINKNNLET